MNILLSEALPLRTSRMLGNFAADFVLAHRYGDLTAARFALGKMTDSRWFAADHPMEITGVFIDDETTAGWAYKTESDGLGHTYTVVDLAAPAPPGAIVSAVGRGKRNPISGALYENPAEIIEDVFRLGGRSDTFPGLRSECAAAGLRVAGSVDKLQSIRSTIDEITGAVGAIWTPELALLYPVSSPTPPILELTAEDTGGLTVSASLTDTADILRMDYDVADATQKPQHYIELSASPQRYGGVVAYVSSAWLRSPQNAETIGRPVLERMNGERYDVSLATKRTDVRPGQWWKLVAHPEWPFDSGDPLLMILTVEVSPDGPTASVTAEAIIERPLITITSHSIALPDTSAGALEVGFHDGVLTLQPVDSKGVPIPGARVALDGSPAKTTDSRGFVSFKTTVGKHTVAIEAPGKVPQKLQISL